MVCVYVELLHHVSNNTMAPLYLPGSRETCDSAIKFHISENLEYSILKKYLNTGFLNFSRLSLLI